jgi:hypothetical protein
MTTQDIHWPSWFAWKVKNADFEARREPHLTAENYSVRFDTIGGGMYTVTIDLPKYRLQPKVNGLMVSTQQRVWDVLNWQSLQYSAGADIDQMRQAWPHALRWAEEYAEFSHRFNQSPERMAGSWPT